MNSQDIKTVTLVINSDQAQKKLDIINNKLETARAKREAAFEKGNSQSLQAYTKEIQNLERQATRLQSRAQTVAKTLGNLDKATPKELRSTIREINKELNSGKIERGSKEWHTLTYAMQKAEAELRKIKEEQNAATTAFGDTISALGNKWFGMVSIADKVTSAFSGAMAAMSEYVNDFAEINEHMANVSKYTGLATEDVNELNESFKRMETKTPREKLNDLAADAGRLGITSKEAVLEFVEAADTINLALGEDLGENAVKNIGKLAQMFGESDRLGLRGAMLATGSVINELAQSSSASEGYIMEFANRLAGVGNQAGLTQAQIMAFGSVLDQNAVNVEKGATALQNALTALFKDPAKMASAAGLEVEKFTNLLKTDANTAVLEWLQALQDTGGMEKLAPLLAQMNLSGAGVTQTLTTLAGKLKDVKTAQELANTAYEQNVSCTDEADKANGTIAARLQRAQERWKDIRRELGERLFPIYEKGIELTYSTGKALSYIANLVANVGKFVVDYRAQITSAAAAVVTFTVAINAANIAHKAHALWLTTVKAVQTAYTAVTGAATAAQTAFNAAIKTNGFSAIISLILSAVAALGTWLLMTNKATDAEKNNTNATNNNSKALDALNQAREEGKKLAEEERAKIDLLNKVVHNGNAKYAERLKALNDLKAIIPDYHAQLTQEGQLEHDNVNAINDYIAALDKKAEAEAVYNKLVEAKRKGVELTMKRDRKQNNVNRVDAELAKEQYKARPGYNRAQYGEALIQDSHVQARDAKLLERTKQVGALNAAQAELNANLREQAELEQYLQKHDLVTTATNNTPTTSATTSHTTNNGKGGSTTTTPKVDTASLTRIENEKRKAQEQAATEYVTGLQTYQQYQEQIIAIDRNYLEQKKTLYSGNAAEIATIDKELAEIQKKSITAKKDWSINQIEVETREQLNALESQHNKALLSDEQYQRQREALEEQALQRRVQYLSNTENGLFPDALYQAEQELDAKRTQNKLNQEKRLLEQINALRRQYANESIEVQQQMELQFMQQLYTQGILTVQEFEEARLAIIVKYKLKQSENTSPTKQHLNQQDNTLGTPSDQMSASVLNLYKSIGDLQNAQYEGKVGWKNYAAVAQASLATVSATMSSVSQLMQANMQAEVASVTARYDAEIEKAGSSTKKGKKLEEQKQKEIAKIKTTYNKRAMAIEIAQAIANTASNAISAYGAMAKIAVVGPALGIAAAAAATAAGMIQIATIKKQHEAEAAGYYEGGFTGGNSYRRTAGVVHEGEFVANHAAVNNPNILPILNLIDQAQRTNRVASLTAADVSRAISAPVTTATNTTTAGTVQVVDTSSAATAATLERLNDRLEQGISAVVTIDGEQGLAKQWKKYQRLTSK